MEVNGNCLLFVTEKKEMYIFMQVWSDMRDDFCTVFFSSFIFVLSIWVLGESIYLKGCSGLNIK